MKRALITLPLLVILILSACVAPPAVAPSDSPVQPTATAGSSPQPSVSAPTPAPAAGDIVVHVEPTSATGAVGDTLTFQVFADSVPVFDAGGGGVQGWQVIISFDPAIVQVPEDAGFFAGNLYDGVEAFPLRMIDNAQGQLVLGQSPLGVQSQYPGGDGLLLATIPLQAANPGTAAVDLDSATMVSEALTGATYGSVAGVGAQVTIQ